MLMIDFMHALRRRFADDIFYASATRKMQSAEATEEIHAEVAEFGSRTQRFLWFKQAYADNFSDISGYFLYTQKFDLSTYCAQH